MVSSHSGSSCILSPLEEYLKLFGMQSSSIPSKCSCQLFLHFFLVFSSSIQNSSEEITVVYSENNTKPINTLCGRSAGSSNVKQGVTYELPLCYKESTTSGGRTVT
jgi:hypothetical protein